VTDLAVLDRDALDAIAALCARALPDPPSIDELEGALFAAAQPAVVRGDPATAVVATVACDDGTHVRLLVVDPGARGRGLGHALVETAEADARSAGSEHLTVGADAPYYLWAGVPSRAIELCCLLERHHYFRAEVNFDMRIDLSALPDDTGGHALATAGERNELDAWMATHWSNWRLEVLRALDKHNLVVARDGDDGDVTAFCAFEVNRAGFLGPVAVRPDLMGRGRGRGVLLGALHELRRRGRDHIDVSWVAPVVPYAAMGGWVSNVYFVYRRKLA
jgi:GNAT superfamily N-acetyltransferase